MQLVLSDGPGPSHARMELIDEHPHPADRLTPHHTIARAKPGDELLHLLVRCYLQIGRFTSEDRRRVSELVAQLRANPTAAGRAAERIERTLSPALPWSALLDEVVHERWDRLTHRRDAVVRHLSRSDVKMPDPPPSDFAGEEDEIGHDDRGAAGDGARAHASETEAKEVEPAPAGASPAESPDSRPDDEEDEEDESSSESVTRKQIRGSGLLLAGRGLSTGLKFLAELIIVRYLSTEDYGSWTYALAAVTFLRGMTALGLSRALSRYLPLHLERDEPRKFYGVLLLVFGSLILASTLVVAGFYAFPSQVASLAGAASDQPLTVLLIIIFLVPAETLDNGLLNVSAVFGDSRTIFIRRFLLQPGLRIGIAGTLVLMQANVILLAWGYLFAGVAGIAYYAWAVVRQLRRRGLLRIELLRGLELPVRRVFSYTAPVMLADWCSVYVTTAGPLLLGYFGDMSSVALYQVVVPAAALNTLVYQSFGMLFEPSASRMFARSDPKGLNQLYWRTAVWVAVLTFPLFAVSFTVAEPLTVMFFGERYAAAAPILSLLAAGQFVDAAAGFNAATLRVTGQVRWLLVVNVLGAVTTVGLSVALIPSYGPVGAGIGTAAGLFVFMIFKQTALQKASGVRAFHPQYRGPYVAIGICGLGLLATRVLWPSNPWILAPAALVASLVVYLSARMTLSITQTFPELGRSRLLRIILG